MDEERAHTRVEFGQPFDTRHAPAKEVWAQPMDEKWAAETEFVPLRSGVAQVFLSGHIVNAVLGRMSESGLRLPGEFHTRVRPWGEFDQPSMSPWGLVDRLHDAKQQVENYGLDSSEAIEACIARLRRASDLCERVHKSLAAYGDCDEYYVQDLLGPGSDLKRLQARSSLLAITVDGQSVFPVFQFDTSERRIIREARRVNELLNAADDPWGVTAWWMQQHGGLGCRPVELLSQDSSERTKLVEAAMAVVEHLD